MSEKSIGITIYYCPHCHTLSIFRSGTKRICDQCHERIALSERNSFTHVEEESRIIKKVSKSTAVKEITV